MLTMIFSETLKENLAVLKSTPFFAIVIAAEILLSNFHHEKVYNWRETGTNFILSLVNGGLDLLIRGGYLLVLAFAWEFRFFIIESSLIYWVALVLIIDFIMYWLHRLEHYCRLFWAVHVTHHSAEHMNATVEFRSSVFQPLYRFIFFIPLAFFGFHPIDIFFVYSLMQTWGLFVHTEMVRKLGLLEYFMVTPSHHRVHHASNVKYLDKNMGFLLIIWDKMFGTFQKELPANEYEAIRYGLTTPLKNVNPVNVIFHEWINIFKDLKRKDIGWRTKLAYLFNPPGWSHDGSRKTSEELRKSTMLDIPEIDGVGCKDENVNYKLLQKAHKQTANYSPG
jgi:sterol desaturase/sphingolipid hydroxylase (fatty acid hydroxylase superfamily)